MVELPSPRSAGAVATACGIAYAVVVLAWTFSSGVYLADRSLPTVAVGMAEALVRTGIDHWTDRLGLRTLR